jgi:hypothetical protein
MLVLSRTLLNSQYNIIHILKATVSTVYMCNLHVIFLSKITPRYFILFTKGMLCPFNVRRDSGGKIRESESLHWFLCSSPYTRPPLNLAFHVFCPIQTDGELIFKLKLFCDKRWVSQPIFVLRPMTRFLLLSDICSLHVVGRPPWRKDGSEIYSYNSLSLCSPSPAELMTTSCLIWDCWVPFLLPLTTRRATVKVLVC